MKNLTIYERAVSIGNYVVENNATVREAARVFDVSKSTVHKDITERLLVESPILQKEVREVLDKNKEERHIRGGEATKRKYKKLNYNNL